MSTISLQSVRSYFDEESKAGRRLLPDEQTVSGLGTYAKYRRAAALMAQPQHAQVLDLGCNRGSVEFLFQELHADRALDTFIEAVDVSSSAIERAKELELPNCHFQLYDGLHLPFSSQSFDLVIMIEVIEHVVQKEELLAEIYRVLRPGGHLFLTTPNPDSLALRFELFLWTCLRRVSGRAVPAKDAFLSQDRLRDLLAGQKLRLVDQDNLYYWPRLFLYFLGWGILPPLPPKWLLAYQRFCVDRLASQPVPAFLARRMYWSLAGLFEKQDGVA